MGTAIVLLVLVVIIGAIIKHLIKQKSACGCSGCSGCASKGNCCSCQTPRD